MENEDDGSDLVSAPETQKRNTRGPKRGPIREEDPRTRAARRAAELRDHLGDMDDGTDEFYINPDDVPEGWTYEWKRKTIMGAEDPAYQVSLARAGWEPVPTSRHPSYMPDTGQYPIIERKGMVLMERPAEIHEEARARDYRRAVGQVRTKESQLQSAGVGEFERSNKDQSLVKVRKSYESIPIPD
ncbi:MAG: hypothetical protein KGL39_55100 [Patescibacteria group bacterium]|nr:hypothetical protein [Patescibacteria group bacterium]